MTYYDILGIPPTASQAEIKEAYRNLLKAFHPDMYQGDPSFAKRKTEEVVEAYNTLKNPELRQRYDAELFFSSYNQSNTYTSTEQPNESSQDSSTTQKAHFHATKVWKPLGVIAAVAVLIIVMQKPLVPDSSSNLAIVAESYSFTPIFVAPEKSVWVFDGHDYFHSVNNCPACPDGTPLFVRTRIKAVLDGTEACPVCVAERDSEEEIVWISAHGTKYHRFSNCSNMSNPYSVFLSEAQSEGRTACAKCY